METPAPDPAPPPPPRGGRRALRMGLRAAGALAAVVVWVPVLVAARHWGGAGAMGWAAAGAMGAGAATLWWWTGRARWAVLAGVVTLAGVVGSVALRTPRNDRDWTPDVARLPRLTVEGDTLTIEGLRDFAWHSLGEADERWVTRTYDLSALETMELIVEPFGDSGLFAHTMLGFGFAGGERLLVSIEARKEKGEAYGLVAGAMGEFELIYVFMDERDGLTLRAIHRGHPVHAFPVRANAAQFRALLEDLAAAANDLHERPRFYRVVLNNCTTAWVRHVDRQRTRKIGLRPATVFPALTGELLHAEGMMATDLPYEAAAERFRIDGKVREHAADGEFSGAIRAPSPPG